MAFKSHTGHKRDLGQKDLRAIVRAVGGGGEASESEAVSTSRLSSGSVSRQTCDQVGSLVTTIIFQIYHQKNQENHTVGYLKVS